MKNQIIISAKGNESRIALIENGELSQFFVESPEVVRSVGDIHLAEVHKVMGGIRAAFIDIGQAKDAFLHFSDVGEHLIDYVEMLNGRNALDHVSPELIRKIRAEQKGSPEDNDSGLTKQSRAADILRNGQRLLVQIVKEPMGSKGPRVSTDISLAGRFVVLIPFGNYVAVSKRIRSHKERRRLRALVTAMLPQNFGVIVRTVAGGQRDEMVEEDLKELLEKWNSIADQMHTAKPPVVLHRDLDMTESLIRDLFAKDYDRILIDDPAKFKTIKNYVQKVAPKLLPNIKAYKGKEHIFDFMKIASDVESIYTPRVKMKSGGYLIFEQTEAMYVVDVNSGRYAAKKNQEENSLKTNLEAAREIAKQLRLRDIGGIIVVDFIDLKDDGNRKKVYDELKKEFRKDKAKTNVLQMSDFGLVQITRQRIRPSINSSISKVCPMCGGSGDVISQNTIITDIDAWLTKFRHLYKYRKVDLYVNPYLRGFLTRGLISKRFQWMIRYFLQISIYADETISMNDFKFTLTGSDIDITDAVISDQPIDMALKQGEEALSKSRRDPSKLDIYGNDEKADWTGVDDSDEDDEDDSNDRSYREDGRRERTDFRDDRREPREQRDPRDNREPREDGRRDLRDRVREPREPREAKEVREPRPPRPDNRPNPRVEETAAETAPEQEKPVEVKRDLREMRLDGTPRVFTPKPVEQPAQAENTESPETQPSAPEEETSQQTAESKVVSDPAPVVAAPAAISSILGAVTAAIAETDDSDEEDAPSKTDKRRKNVRSKYYKKPKNEATEPSADSTSETVVETPVANPAPVTEQVPVTEAVQETEKPAKPKPAKPKPAAKKKPVRKPARGKASPDDVIVDGGDEE